MGKWLIRLLGLDAKSLRETLAKQLAAMTPKERDQAARAARFSR